MSHLPFEPSKPLSEIIGQKYLIEALKWLSDTSDSETVLAVKLGSLWAVAYTVLCFLECRGIYLPSSGFPGGFEEKTKKAVRYLIQKASFGPDTCHWDGGAWDTAVICRALIMYGHAYRNSDVPSNIQDVICKALRWLRIQVLNWERARYTYGVADLAQILQTVVMAHELIPSLAKQVFDEHSAALGHRNLVDLLTDEIIRMAELKHASKGELKGDIAVWDDDVYPTAEVLIGLRRYRKTLNLPLLNDVVM